MFSIFTLNWPFDYIVEKIVFLFVKYVYLEKYFLSMFRSSFKWKKD